MLKNLSSNQIIWISIGGAVVFVVLAFVGRKIYLSAKQENYIKNLNPQAQKQFRKLIDRIEKMGWKVRITSGYRDFAKQKYLKAQNSKNARAGYSEHNYGIALDMNVSKGGERLRKSTSKSKWEASGIPQLAKQMGFRWGGDFKGYHDPIHFGLGHIFPTKDLLAKAHQKFGTNPNNIQGNLIKLT